MTRARKLTVELDCLIVGGGAAGLWVLNRLVAKGYEAALIERNVLGGGQTIHAQGIIHSGTKYSLKGAASDSSRALAEMPRHWRKCLSGQGEIDLSSVPVLAGETFFAAGDSLLSRAAGFVASRILRARTAHVADEDRPEAFHGAQFSGQVYTIREAVIDVPSLVKVLATPRADRIFRLDAAKASFENGGLRWQLPSADITIRARRIILTAGQGFEELSGYPGLAGLHMQKRPLHMVMVEHDCPVPVFGHFIGASSIPLLTITTHAAGEGRFVWYLGGGLAEAGVSREPEAQIAAARSTIGRCMPWLEPGRAEWRTVHVQRAEAAQPGGQRPAGPFVGSSGKFIVAWPTKLALIPVMCRRILALLPEPIMRDGGVQELTDVLPLPPLAAPPWGQGS